MEAWDWLDGFWMDGLVLFPRFGLSLFVVTLVGCWFCLFFFPKLGLFVVGLLVPGCLLVGCCVLCTCIFGSSLFFFFQVAAVGVSYFIWLYVCTSIILAVYCFSLPLLCRDQGYAVGLLGLRGSMAGWFR